MKDQLKVGIRPQLYEALGFYFSFFPANLKLENFFNSLKKLISLEIEETERVLAKHSLPFHFVGL